MTIILCNSHPFTFYLPFHTSLRADQCPIQSHVPSTCTLGLDPCARHSLFGRTDPYYIDNFYSSCGLKRLAATLASPLLCNCTVLPVPLSTGPYLVLIQCTLGKPRRTVLRGGLIYEVAAGTCYVAYQRAMPHTAQRLTASVRLIISANITALLYM